MTRALGMLLVGAALLGACRSEIGDECSLSQDCNQTEVERFCLTEAVQRFPGGYCTSFGCSPNGCSEEAICVAYRASLASTAACSEGTNTQRLQQTYCMRACDSADDCRDGYDCVELLDDNPWGASALDSDGRRQICMPAYSEPEMPPVRQSDVCVSRLPSAADAGGDIPDAAPPPLWPADASADAAADAASGISRDGAPFDAGEGGVSATDASVRSDASQQGTSDAAPAGPVPGEAGVPATLDAAGLDAAGVDAAQSIVE